jgi:signal transduction histidine kinase
MDEQFARPDAALGVESLVPPLSELVRNFDWANTPLGPAESWPESLKTTIRILLTSRFPMWMAWGPELTFLYNEAYARATLGKKHPWALGKPSPAVWPEIWNVIGPRIERVMQSGEASWEERVFLLLERSGYPEETWHTISFSPLAGADDHTEGVLCVAIEETARVIGERQMVSLSTLAAALVDANTRDEVFAAITRGISDHRDIPFALTYLFEGDGAKLRLVAQSGIEAGHKIACAEMPVGSADCPWPVDGMLAASSAVTVEGLAELFPDRPLGAWDRAPSQARLMPICHRGQVRPAGVFIAALNPYRPLNPSYSEFLDRVAGQIAAAITSAEAYEQERNLRRQAREREAALTREIQRARQFAWETLEHLPDAFGTFDRDFRITYLNPAASKLVARSTPSAPLGEILWNFYPDLVGTPVEANFRRAMQTREPLEFEQYFPTPSGDFWFHFQLYPQPHDGLALYVHNTSATRRTEQALRRSEQLAAAGRLAASIAHEINNPLEAVTNLLFLVNMDDSIQGPSKELLQVADRELQRLSHITARSLKFYRQRTAPSLTSLEELIESVLFFHETEMRMRGIQLHRRYHPAQPVLCLAGEMQQVFTNLLSNALDALEDGGRLMICVRQASDGKAREGVAVTIADSGTGMSPATLDQLFHPFMTTRGEEGTGLGLWVSKGILDKHHSTIKVRSKPGLGSVFRIFIPLDTTAA